MRTIEQLKAIPFYKLTVEEKKFLVANAQKRAVAAPAGREASIASMIAETMQKAR